MVLVDTPNPANPAQQQIGQTAYDAQEEARRKKQAGLGPDGRPIPNAGVYGQEQANAELAWQNARTTADTKLKSHQNQAGVLADGSVDPRNTHGGYQQLLHTQGSELDQAQESAMGRGLGGGPGLGNQAERGLRFGHAVQNLGFQRGLSDAQANYGMELGQADAVRRNAMTAALQNALNNAWGDWTPPEMGTPDSEDGGVADPTYNPYSPNAVKARSVADVKNNALAKYGWGAAATYAKAQPKKAAPKPAPKPAAKPILHPSTTLTKAKVNALNAAIAKNNKKK